MATRKTIIGFGGNLNALSIDELNNYERDIKEITVKNVFKKSRNVKNEAIAVVLLKKLNRTSYQQEIADETNRK